MGTPKSSILIGSSIINHPFWGTPNFWTHKKKSLQLTSDDETSRFLYSFKPSFRETRKFTCPWSTHQTQLTGDFSAEKMLTNNRLFEWPICWDVRFGWKSWPEGNQTVSHDASMGLVYLPTFFVDFYGTCREIYTIHGCYGYDILVNHSCFKQTFWPPED